MIDKMLQRGLIFAPTPSGARTPGQRQDPGLCNNTAAQHDHGSQQSSPNQFCANHNVLSDRKLNICLIV